MRSPRASAVFFAESPLQLLSAVEARHAYAVAPDDALLVTGPTADPEGQRQLEALTTRYGWRACAHDQAWESEVEPGARTFIGDYRKAWQRAATRRLGGPEPVLLDDGNSTVLLAIRRRRPWWRLTDRSTTWQRGRGDRRVPVPGLVYDLRDPASREHGSVEFFTIYRVQPGRRDRLRTNFFDVLRAGAPASARSRPVYIGSNLAEKGLMDPAAVDKRVADVSERWGPELLYVAHRRESDEKLARYQRAHGIEIVRPSFPIELFLTDGGIVPDPLLGIFSTAFDSLRVVFPGLDIETRPPTADEIPRRSRRPVLRLVRLTESIEVADPGLRAGRPT
ncbi:MAG: hypothetical protein QOG87_2913 [Actinomycetota bacterium]|jgi:hypothetical protein